MSTLIKFLTGAGLGSRRSCFQLITQGKVTVNGIPATSTTLEIGEHRDSVTVNGEQVTPIAAKIYLKINKPLGVLSAVSDKRGQRTVSDLVPREFSHLRLFPVGRLDKDSTGLILMTNDGDLAYHLTHPRYEFEKEYHFLVDNELTAAQIRSLQKGVVIDEHCASVPARPRFEFNRIQIWDVNPINNLKAFLVHPTGVRCFLFL